MSAKSASLWLALTGLVLVLLIVTLGAVGPDDLVKALVINLETPHPIDGEVSVRGTIRHAEVVRIRDVVVAPSGKEEPARWVDAGTVTTEGFTSLVLSVQGQVKGSVSQPGAIGVVLVADEEPIVQALSEGQVQLSLEAAAEVVRGSSYFSGSKSSLPIAFPVYRVFLYNSTDQSAAANVFVYLTN